MDKLKEFLQKWGVLLQGLVIIVLLLSVWFAYDKNNDLKEKINGNCGWGEEDFYCYCEKGEAVRLKNLAENQELEPIIFQNISEG